MDNIGPILEKFRNDCESKWEVKFQAKFYPDPRAL